VGDGRDVTVPAPGVSLSVGGWRREALVFTWHEDGRAWAVTVDDARGRAALLDALPSAFAGDVARARRDAQRLRGRRSLALALLALIVLLPVAAVAGLYLWRDRIVDAVVRRLPYSVDVALAEATHRQLVASGLVVRDGAAREAVQRVGDRLLAAAPPHPFRLRFEVLRDPTVNAFAVPGGLVVVHAGLVADARTPDELAGVVAHEITHVLERHSLRQLLFQLGLRTSLGLLLGLPDGVADAVGTAAANLGGLRFSRDQERAADRGAVELLARARLPAGGLESFFERLARQEGRGLAIVSTHPPSAERVAALRQLLVERGTWPTDPLALDWERVRQDGAARGAGRPAQSRRMPV
jgi:predicted Zn-dependent protease